MDTDLESEQRRRQQPVAVRRVCATSSLHRLRTRRSVRQAGCEPMIVSRVRKVEKILATATAIEYGGSARDSRPCLRRESRGGQPVPSGGALVGADRERGEDDEDPGQPGHAAVYPGGPPRAAGYGSDVWTSLRGDAMTQVAMGEIGELRAAMQGPVIAPGDPGFDAGRRVWNAPDRPASFGDRPLRVGSRRGRGDRIRA